MMHWTSSLPNVHLQTFMEADKIEAFTLMQMKVFFYGSLHLDFYEYGDLVVVLMRFQKFM